jgi:hypothetical protein
MPTKDGHMDLTSGKLSIVGLDPGGTTGWALYTCDVMRHTVDPDIGVSTVEFFNEKFTRGQIGPGHHHLRLWNFLEQWTTTNTIIVCESFEFRKNEKDRTRDNIVLDSKEYIGIVNLYKQTFDATTANRIGGLQVVYQTAAIGKGFWTDNKLQVAGRLATPKTRWVHANDAMRHLLYYMTFTMKRQDLLESLRNL